MESVNKVELVGHAADPRVHRAGETYIYNVPVCTENAYKDHGDNIIVDCCWINVVYFCDKHLNIRKGDAVKVEGRLRQRKFTSSDGHETYNIEILANNLVKL